MADIILNVSHLTKTFLSDGHPLTVVRDVSFSLEAGSTCSVVGPSGSGKTTLLGLCAGLDQATSGNVTVNGQRLDQMNEEERAAVRNETIGFIFQNFQLIPTLTTLENVMVPLELRGNKNALFIRSESFALLERVGLAERAGHYPLQLSGGEQQRVALARAFVNRPSLLFADEPMGNLDAENADLVANLLFDLNKEAGTTLVLVTHNLELAGRTHKILRLKNGELKAGE